MVVLSLEEYSKLTDSVEIALDKTDGLAAENANGWATRKFSEICGETKESYDG